MELLDSSEVFYKYGAGRTVRMSRVRKGLFIAGLFVALAAIGMPREWYDRIPPNADLPLPPMSGLTLLQLSLGAEALLLIWLSFRPSRARPGIIRLTAIIAPVEADGQPGRRTTAGFLIGITLLGLLLRLWRLDSDLWLDEIAPLVVYGPMSAAQVMASYLGSNNHLLNTLLVKLSVAALGEHEWSVRLPAVIFGTATIPVFYWAARFVLTRANSLAAALLLAVSYHHIFFSQNARGYTAYVCIALLSSVCFSKALGDSRPRTWALYVGTMFLGMAALLISVFVFSSHAAVGGGVLLAMRRRGQPWRLAARTLITVFAVTAFLVFQLYAMILPQAYVYMRSVYTQADSGYALLSVDFFAELARGVLVAFGAGVSWMLLPILVAGFAVGIYGWVRLAKRRGPLILSLTLPGVFTMALVALGSLSVSPRFFLLALPLTILVMVEALSTITEAAWRRCQRPGGAPAPLWLWPGAVVPVAALMLLPLPAYYSMPKQAYVASADYVRQARTPDDIVVVVHLAEMGYRYYGPRVGLQEGPCCVYLRSKEALDAVVRAHPRGRVLLVTTFLRAMRLGYPDLAASIEQGWMVDRIFPGTVGEGDIAVWIPR